MQLKKKKTKHFIFGFLPHLPSPLKVVVAVEVVVTGEDISPMVVGLSVSGPVVLVGLSVAVEVVISGVVVITLVVAVVISVDVVVMSVVGVVVMSLVAVWWVVEISSDESSQSEVSS